MILKDVDLKFKFGGKPKNLLETVLPFLTILTASEKRKDDQSYSHKGFPAQPDPFVAMTIMLHCTNSKVNLAHMEL